MGADLSTTKRKIANFCDKPNGGMLGLLGLQVALQYGHPDSARPPVTAALIVANSLVYLRLGDLRYILPFNFDMSFNPYRIIEGGQWTRLLTSPFVHAHEAHLFLNMSGLLWMGSGVEQSMGSAKFASMVAALLGLSQGITLLLCRVLESLGEGGHYNVHHAVGFSGVVFAMKTVLTAGGDDIVPLGFIMPLKYTTWAELLLNQLTVPHSSFLGHLGGILAGYAYIGLNRLFGGADLPTMTFTPPPGRGRANHGRRRASAGREPPRALHVKTLLSRGDTYGLFEIRLRTRRLQRFHR
ncbi:hypothetical protein PR202_gb27632 [Eleusine coracana subsp. coracana]|uniref:Peptidase S54 rhomboid domain-containing protein n=1 Tax=Eleusine coracana subsp. coracana TaxID=191504 RepID=A0AAV5FVA0_ELECO|nr:hypothetical protein PR202_gb27632 [Eleusine coracana subsp. coracana]